MIIYYRLSDGSYPKVRFQNATKVNCLRNFLNMFGGYRTPSYKEFGSPADQIVLLLDNVKDETVETITTLVGSQQNYFPISAIRVRRTYAGSSAGSFRLVLEMALELPDDTNVYFVEDDYAHLLGARHVLLEGLGRADYVTLYNHPDKYLPASEGGNPLVGDDGAEQSKVFVTDHAYWMLTNSTTMTFATTVGILRQDQDIWKAYTQGSYPQDMQIFLELRRRGRTLIQPIPTFSTHCEPAWAAKLIGTGVKDWEDVLA